LADSSLQISSTTVPQNVRLKPLVENSTPRSQNAFQLVPSPTLQSQPLGASTAEKPAAVPSSAALPKPTFETEISNKPTQLTPTLPKPVLESPGASSQKTATSRSGLLRTPSSLKLNKTKEDMASIPKSPSSLNKTKEHAAGLPKSSSTLELNRTKGRTAAHLPSTTQQISSLDFPSPSSEQHMTISEESSQKDFSKDHQEDLPEPNSVPSFIDATMIHKVVTRSIHQSSLCGVSEYQKSPSLSLQKSLHQSTSAHLHASLSRTSYVEYKAQHHEDTKIDVENQYIIKEKGKPESYFGSKLKPLQKLSSRQMKNKRRAQWQIFPGEKKTV